MPNNVFGWCSFYGKYENYPFMSECVEHHSVGINAKQSEVSLIDINGKSELYPLIS